MAEKAGIPALPLARCVIRGVTQLKRIEQVPLWGMESAVRIK